MGLANAELTPLTLSTSNLPERDRLPVWREVIGHKLVHVDIEPLRDIPFGAEATLLAWPGLRVFWGTSTPACWRTLSQMLVDGDEPLSLIICKNGSVCMRQGAGELPLAAGEAAGVVQPDSAKLTAPQNGWTAIVVGRSRLRPFVSNVDQKTMRLIPRDNSALRLLEKYSSNLREEPDQMSAELRHLAVSHIHDLIAMALGPTRDGAAIANEGGVRAARLSAIKADILKNITSANLTVGEVAQREGVTPRYIHMLFESEGATFTKFVCEARLRRAHSMLVDPRFCDRSVMTIAFAAGFGDLSYFNRCFRRRFGTAPSELRCENCRKRKNCDQAKFKIEATL